MDNLAGKNIAAKILALILASILWIYVMNEQNPPIETSFSVPLEQRNLTDNYLVTDGPDTVRVRLRGPRSIIAGVAQSDIKCYVDLSNLSEGRYALKVHTLVPASLEITEVNPDKVILHIDRYAVKKLPVEIRLKGTALVGMIVSKTASVPTEVTIEGAKKLVDTALRVVANVDLTGKNTDFTEDVKLVALNRDGREIEGITITPPKANITLNLLKQQNKASVGIKYITFGDLPKGTVIKSITTQPDKIEINGSKEELDKISYIYTEPINLSGINENTTREVKLQIKEGIVSSHSKVTVHINVQPTNP